MTTNVYPPDFSFSRLDIRAVIDFITISTPMCSVRMHEFDGRARWRPEGDGDDGCLTLQDPQAKELAALAREFPRASVMEIEIAVDFMPAGDCDLAERTRLIDETMLAIAGRLWPEEANPFGFGLRACVSGKGVKPSPFHDRPPPPGAQLLWGGRGDWIQVKAYPKRTDNRQQLAPTHHRARVEVALRRGYLMDLGIQSLDDVLHTKWRQFLSPFFRFIARPALRVRAGRRIDPKLEVRAQRQWHRGGVGGFRNAQLPREALLHAVEHMNFRASRQIALGVVRLERHRLANARVGDALRQLDRRLQAARISDGDGLPPVVDSQR